MHRYRWLGRLVGDWLGRWMGWLVGRWIDG